MSISDKPQLPGEIIEYICSLIPLTDLATHTILLRTSKLFCRIAAPRIYEKISITPDQDFQIDTGLPADLLDDTDVEDKAEYRVEESSRVGSGTLKLAFLKLICKIEIYPRRPDATLSQNTLPHDNTDNIPLSEILGQGDPCVNHFKRDLVIRLDTSTHHRRSPFDNSDLNPSASTPSGRLLLSLCPRRLILYGAGFHQTESPTTSLPLPLFDNLQEVLIVITPGTVPPPGDMLSMNHGLPFIFNTLLTSILSINRHIDSTRTKMVNITFILKTPKPGFRFPAMDPPPQGGMPMTMDYHPDYAPGYLHPLTTLLGQRMVVLRSASSESAFRRIGVVRFVNFGALDGEQVGMPQAAVEEMQERFEKGIRVRLSRAGIRGEKQGLEVLGMKEWLECDERKGKDVLDDHILRGWNVGHQVY